jgi:hypothetical protein
VYSVLVTHMVESLDAVFSQEMEKHHTYVSTLCILVLVTHTGELLDAVFSQEMEKHHTYLSTLCILFL